MSEPLEQEDKRPEPPVVAMLVPVVITMTATQAAEYASFYALEDEELTPSGAPYGAGDQRAVTDLQERGISENMIDALMLTEATGDQLWSLVTVTVLPEEVVPAGEPFPGRKGFVTGLCGHAVAGSEWAAGFRTCERCHAVQA
jgi:hypothetical protein